MHKFNNIDIFLYSLNLKIDRDKEISQFNYNSKHYDKRKLWSQTASNLFALEVLQISQHCQLYVLWENSTTCVQNKNERNIEHRGKK